MSDVFLENGHLSDEGLKALIQGTLNELERLEAAEHLSFCDDCLVRYTSLLSGDALQTPAQDQTLPVMRRLRQKGVKALVSRYTAAAAAVMITGALWYSGVFANVAATLTAPLPDLAAPPAAQQQVQAQPQNGWSDSVVNAVNGWAAAIQEAMRPAYQRPQGQAGEADQSGPAQPQQEPAAQPGQTDPAQPEAQPQADTPRKYSLSSLFKGWFDTDTTPQDKGADQ